MLSFLRANTPRTATAHLNPVTYESGRASQHFHTPSATYMMTDVLPATTATNGRSFMNPPLHYHAYQTEDFEVVAGTGRWFLDGTAKTLNKGDRIHVPSGAFHRFENASNDGEDLVVSFRLDEQNFATEEKFFRNFFGYIDDCQKAGRQPSIFQIERFLWEIRCPIVLPGLGERSTLIARMISWSFMVLAGIIVGEWLLGYKGTYSEYYWDEKEARKPKAN